MPAAGRGVRVRLISDNDQRDTKGSDVERLRAAGVPTRVDRDANHMHHKFMVGPRAEGRRQARALRSVPVACLLGGAPARASFAAHTSASCRRTLPAAGPWPASKPAPPFAPQVLDGRFVFTGSLNWTIAGILHNRENVMVVDSAPTAAKYSDAFNRMWAEFA